MMPAVNGTELFETSTPGVDPLEDERMELYSIVLSSTILVLAILFGGGGCVTVLIAMCVHKLLRKLRYILLAILLLICCVFDFIWCPIEIARMVLHHQNFNTNSVSNDTIHELKHTGSGFYILLLSGLAAMIALICVQNILKLLHRYDSIPKIKFGVITILIWLLMCTCLTVVYVIIAIGDTNIDEYHSFASPPFYFKIGVQTMWVILLLMPAVLIVILQMQTKIWKSQLVSETSDLHSNDNFTVPSLIIKSVEEIDEDDNETSEALPSPDIQKDSSGGSPISKSSKSALKKRSGSPSSQKVMFSDDMPSPSRDEPSPSFGERFKSPNHLGVNMAAILGRRRHTIAQITDPHLDLMQKAKTYNYVRKFSVDISALQAQLENPKLHPNFQFHSQQELKGAENKSDQDLQNSSTNIRKSNDNISRKSRDEMIRSQEIQEEPEIESADESEDKEDTDENVAETDDNNADTEDNNADTEDNNADTEDNVPDTDTDVVDGAGSLVKDKASGTANNVATNTDNNVADSGETQSVVSQSQSVRSTRSARDSMCPTPPLISLTQSDGEEKQLDPNNTEELDDSYQSKKSMRKFNRPCKLSCLLIAIFIVSILPMFITELLRYSFVSSTSYINSITCMTAISLVQTMIYPQVIFCVDLRINRAVHCCFIKTRRWITSQVFGEHEEVPTLEDMSDTEV